MTSLNDQIKPHTKPQLSPWHLGQVSVTTKQVTFRPWIAVGKICLRLIVFGAVCALLWAGYLRMTGNVHTIEEGQAYRSGQLSANTLLKLIGDKKIRTVINLRGYNGGKSWYDAEIEAAHKARITHVDLALSANRKLSDQQLSRLSDILIKSPKPILIHCEGGADRAGLAAAMYELIVAGRSALVAGTQLSFRFGHFPWLGSRTVAMDQTWDHFLANSIKNQNHQEKR